MPSTIALQTRSSSAAPAEIRQAIQVASADTGVSFSYLMAKAAVESNFRADAEASTSSATGLYQFIESTWLDMVKEHGAEHGLDHYADALKSGGVDKRMRAEILELRKDPQTSALMAAEFARENRDYLQRTVGGEIGDTELYLAHFLGPDGARKFISAMRRNPRQIAVQVAPQAAQANRSVFYGPGGARTLEQVYRRFAAKLGDETAVDIVRTARPAASAKPARLDTAAAAPSGAIRSPLGGARPWAQVSPTTYAARMFLSTLTLPGETRQPRAG